MEIFQFVENISSKFLFISLKMSRLVTVGFMMGKCPSIDETTVLGFYDLCMVMLNQSIYLQILYCILYKQERVLGVLQAAGVHKYLLTGDFTDNILVINSVIDCLSFIVH